jgi:hypothetical protein
MSKVTEIAKEPLEPKWKAHHIEPAKPDHYLEPTFLPPKNMVLFMTLL